MAVAVTVVKCVRSGRPPGKDFSDIFTASTHLQLQSYCIHLWSMIHVFLLYNLRTDTQRVGWIDFWAGELLVLLDHHEKFNSKEKLAKFKVLPFEKNMQLPSRQGECGDLKQVPRIKLAYKVQLHAVHYYKTIYVQLWNTLLKLRECPECHC